MRIVSRWATRLLTVAALISATTLVASPTTTPPAHADGNANKNCGDLTCSWYVDRYTTKELARIIDQNGWQTNLASGAVCSGVGAATGAVGGVFCEAEWGWVQEELKRAANDHPPKGACLKLTYIPGYGGNPDIPTYWSTNNGKYCRD